ncbi:L,D-transpeptidase [Pelagicoccus albus]|uniref:L,D-transpeptidase n=1 Tax=Pelagicoccus albus TaxID=415222 RepID=A0A7X1B3Z1_9BACT|nr:L,D-transpeptidase [Pelagicoccus albus]MBC2605204.1 L,D-transpeptidase [Pelagicoccus albus]
MSSDLLQPITHKLDSLEIKQTARILHVSIAKQRMRGFQNGRLWREFVVSTGKKPPSCVENSFGTPTGLHRIAEKHGGSSKLGAVLRSRIDSGELYWELPEEEQEKNLVTTRILWLEGLEPGHNQGGDRDTYNRYVYIHGTNHEDRIGEPASGGCVLLRNREMIELFDFAEIGDLVLIEL